MGTLFEIDWSFILIVVLLAVLTVSLVVRHLLLRRQQRKAERRAARRAYREWLRSSQAALDGVPADGAGAGGDDARPGFTPMSRD
ncbi:hypothetical protein [Pseudorhodoferax sp.]|uniref:hypothetical protein n=1 Tax=Pseudorhodoferax sp. TaxID=1993553 RepID=UPI0039E324F8